MNTLVGKTIYQQLGGQRFETMTGARNFVAHGDGLAFRVPTRKGPNYVKITLTPMDVYTMEFTRIRGLKGTNLHLLTDL